MDINKYIREFLAENPSVVVPGLGRFIAVDKPSVIIGDVVLPPIRTVEFNSTDDEDDGIFTAYIAEQDQIDIEKARTETAEFYDQLKGKLANRKTILLNDLGTLSVNDVGDIIFTPDIGLHIERKDSYGLASINLHGGGETIIPDPVISAQTIESPLSVPVETEPVQATQSTTTPEPEIISPQDTIPAAVPEESLFASEHVRVHENTERRSIMERREPPVKPPRAGATPPPQTKKKQQPEKKKKTSTAGNGFPMWIVLVLLIAGALGIGFYFGYPKISPYIDSTISSIKGSKKTNDKTQTAQTTTGTEKNTPNSEVAQTLDDATNKKNALNPAGESTSQPSAQPTRQTATPSQTPTQSASQTSTQPVTKPATSTTTPDRSQPAPKQGSVGQGKYLLIVGSFTTQAGAEKFGKTLQNAGINYEIIDFGGGRVRVAVASYNNKTEAFNQVNNFKTKPHCENVWVLSR